jgi:hypothetical protein
MVLSGRDVYGSLSRVCDEYCPEAVETRAQERYLFGFEAETRQELK